MKKKLILMTMIAAITLSISAIPPYFKLEVRSGTIGEMAEIVRGKLATGGFEILGEYYPGDADHLYVIAFTNDDLTNLALASEDRGILASVMKVGITLYDGKVTVSVTNPEYLFNAYLRDGMEQESVRGKVAKISSDIISSLMFEGTTPEGFGGDEPVEDLRKYRYMVSMPTFDKPVELRTFSSFEEGLKIIRKNMDAGKGNTEKVYEYVFEGKRVAMFGIGLLDQGEGSARFLPIIGEDHVAAMPYEIVLQGDRATILHGRFRFALHWPELKMTTFTRIMSSPGDVEEVLKALTE